MLNMNLIEFGVNLAKWALIAYSILGLAVIAERIWVLRKLEAKEAEEFLGLQSAAKAGRNATVKGESATALAITDALNIPFSSESQLTETIGRGIGVQGSVAQNRLNILATIASTAPYVGLFGTVLGILAAFRKIAETGDTGASVVSGEISEALITTALGLGVAIPAVIAYNYFSRRVETYLQTIENHALEIGAHLWERHKP
jgi:biopolymer transport protein ExbB